MGLTHKRKEVVVALFGEFISNPNRPAVYGSRSRSTKSGSGRRTNREIALLREALYEILAAGQPMTVRQLFYRAVAAYLIAKTEAEYKNSVVRQLVLMREAGEVPYSWICDNTRWQRRPQTFSGVGDALRSTAACYRRNLWDDQDAYVEVWTEKHALAGVLMEETWELGVPLMVSRGFSSRTFLYSAAEAIKEVGKPAYLYYFGDHDPSGVHIDRNIERRLRQMAPDAEIYFQRVAVLPEQIVELDLPTRPTKRTDSRARTFEGDSVEVDSIEPLTLRQMVRGCIEQHIDQRQLEVTRVAEESERAILEKLARRKY
jgi:hypothetical protein